MSLNSQASMAPSAQALPLASPSQNAFAAQVADAAHSAPAQRDSPPATARQYEKTVADVIEGDLRSHAFRRTTPSKFERRFPGGNLTLRVRAEALDQAQTGLLVDVEVMFFFARRLLQANPALKKYYLPSAPSMLSPLQLLAASSPGTDALFVTDPPGPYTLVAANLAHATALARKSVIPMLAALTENASPWFEDPKTVVDLQLKCYLSHEQAPAGFEFVCMEDLILARLCGSGQLEKLAIKRFQAEQRFAASGTPGRRWSSAEGLQQVYRYAVEQIQPNEWLCLPSPAASPAAGIGQASESLGLQRFWVRLALLVQALPLAAWLAWLQWPALFPGLILALAACLATGAYALHGASRLMPGHPLFQAALPLCVLLPPLHIAALAWTGLRLHRAGRGLSALIARAQ